jgi:alkylation response protein AidB-like acyl-CoA dehydrogenase
MHSFRFSLETFPSETRQLREKVRAFLASERKAGTFVPHRCSWSSFDPEFSRRAAKAGFVGMTLPKEYGGHGLSSLARFAVTEEMLAGGAPCGAHWIADRQSGPQIIKHGTSYAKSRIVPRICAGECYFGIGMSEPDSGSDLAAVRTRAERADGGFVINGTKVWTSNGHRVHYLLALVRTGDAGSDRHCGLTQFIIDLSAPGVTVRPINDLAGNHEFNEIFFNDFRVGDEMMVGAEGEGWKMVTEELAFERSGPDRFLSDYRLLAELVDEIGAAPDRQQAVEMGRLVSHLAALMTMSASVAELLDRKEVPNVEAARSRTSGRRSSAMCPKSRGA